MLTTTTYSYYSKIYVYNQSSLITIQIHWLFTTKIVNVEQKLHLNNIKITSHSTVLKYKTQLLCKNEVFIFNQDTTY